MKAQTLLDFRNRTRFTSGQDLADWFEDQLGDSCPPGDADIDTREAALFVARQLSEIAHNSPTSLFDALGL